MITALLKFAQMGWVIILTIASPDGSTVLQSNQSYATAAECIAAIEVARPGLESDIKEKHLPFVIVDMHCDLTRDK